MQHTEANTQLLAAAPELLAALKDVEGYLVEQTARRHRKSFADQRAGSDAETLLPIVRAAIAAATK